MDQRRLTSVIQSAEVKAMDHSRSHPKLNHLSDQDGSGGDSVPGKTLGGVQGSMNEQDKA